MLESHLIERARAPPSPDATPPFTPATQDPKDDPTQASEMEASSPPPPVTTRKEHARSSQRTHNNSKKCRIADSIGDIRRFFPTINTQTTSVSTDNNTDKHDDNKHNTAIQRKTTDNDKPLHKFLVQQDSTQQPSIQKPYLDALLTNNYLSAASRNTTTKRHSKQPTPNSHTYTLRPQLDLSNHMTFNPDITSTWRAADETLFQTNNEGNFKVATWNCNQLTETKTEYIAWYMASMDIDVLFIQDTRLTPAM